MSINIKKCELLSDTENETKTDSLTNLKLTSILTVKYLGQYIDSEGNIKNMINKFEYIIIN